MKRTIIIVVVLIIIAAAWYVWNLTQEKRHDIVNKKPDVVVTANDLLTAFSDDSVAARKKYVDKIVEVTGNVKKIDTSGSVVLGEEGSASEITIGFDERHLKDIGKLKLGSIAVIQGICSGSTNDTNSDPTDLLAGLGATVEFRSAGVKEKK